MIIKTAMVQEAPVFLNLEASLDKAEAAIRRAADAGAQLISFAECWLPGYPVWLDFSPNAALWDNAGAKALYSALHSNAVTLESKHTARLQMLADETGAVIVMGTHERRGGTLTNTAMTFMPRAQSSDQATTGPVLRRKLVPTYTERLVWGRGDGATLAHADTHLGRVGTLICWEHWMPLARAAMHAAREDIHVAQWPVVKDMHLVASRHYAFEGRTPVLATGSFMTLGDIIGGYKSLIKASGGTLAGSHDGLALLEAMGSDESAVIHSGGSVAVAADGSLMGEQQFGSETIVFTDIDLSANTADYMTLDTSGHYSRPDIFELHVNTRPQPGVTFGPQAD